MCYPDRHLRRQCCRVRARQAVELQLQRFLSSSHTIQGTDTMPAPGGSRRCLYGPDGKELPKRRSRFDAIVLAVSRASRSPLPILSAIVAVLSMGVSWHFSNLSRQHSEAALRNTGGSTHIEMLLELDKILIERPELWSIYDEAALPAGTPGDPYIELRKEALSHYYLNMFERVFSFYSTIAPETGLNKSYMAAWKRYLAHWLKNSSIGKQQARRVLDQNIFPEHFSKLLRAALRDAGSGS